MLSGTGKRFNFTFNSSGNFKFQIAENTHVALNASNFTGENRTDLTRTYEVCNDDSDEDETNDNCRTFTVKLNDKASQAEYMKQVIDTDTFIRQSILIKVSGKQVGNGTFPIINATKIPISSGYIGAQNRAKIPVNASPKSKPGAVILTNIAPPTPKVLESYHEFTLFETFKRWFNILKGG